MATHRDAASWVSRHHCPIAQGATGNVYGSHILPRQIQHRNHSQVHECKARSFVICSFYWASELGEWLRHHEIASFAFHADLQAIARHMAGTWWSHPNASFEGGSLGCSGTRGLFLSSDVFSFGKGENPWAIMQHLHGTSKTSAVSPTDPSRSKRIRNGRRWIQPAAGGAVGKVLLVLFAVPTGWGVRCLWQETTMSVIIKIIIYHQLNAFVLCLVSFRERTKP